MILLCQWILRLRSFEWFFQFWFWWIFPDSLRYFHEWSYTGGLFAILGGDTIFRARMVGTSGPDMRACALHSIYENTDKETMCGHLHLFCSWEKFAPIILITPAVQCGRASNTSAIRYSRRASARPWEGDSACFLRLERLTPRSLAFAHAFRWPGSPNNSGLPFSRSFPHSWTVVSRGKVLDFTHSERYRLLVCLPSVLTLSFPWGPYIKQES